MFKAKLDRTLSAPDAALTAPQGGNMTRRAMLATTTAALAAPGAALGNFSSCGTASDAAAAAERAAEIVRVLRTYHVRDGWQIDEDAAGRALAWFNGRVSGRVRDDEPMTDEGMAAMRFLNDHGQSLDWVFMGDTTGLICAAAKHSKQAARCIAVDDPIFAVIEAHRAAGASYSAAIEASSRLEDELPAERCKYSWTVWDTEPPANCDDDPRWLACEFEQARAMKAIDDTAAQMVHVRPATLAGCAALLSFAAETYAVDDSVWQLPENLADDDGTERPFVHFILKSAALAIGGAA